MSDPADMLRPPGRQTRVGWPEILRALVAKELKIKYKRSALGFLWSLVTPIALTGIYLFVFVYVYKVPEEDFILFLLTGLLPWQYFSMSLAASTTSIIQNAPLIRKVYFPRHLLPISTVGANLFNFLVALGFLAVVLVVSGRPIWLQLHWLIVAMLLETVVCVGASLVLSVWNVYLRDIGQLISIVLMVLFFATPIVYDASRVPEGFVPLILANPLSQVIEIYRAALFSVQTPDLTLVLLGFGEALAVLMLGIFVFRRHSPDLAKQV